MANFAGHPFSATKNLWLKGHSTYPGVLRLTRGSTDPGFGAGDGDYLYNLNGNLVYEAAGTTTTLGAVGGVGTTWESLYTNDNAWSLNGAFTITQAGNSAWTIDKTATGAGAVLALQNAGSGVDLSITNVTAGSTGVVLYTRANSASAADADVIFEHQVRGNDDAGTPAEVAYGRVRWIAADTGAASEDGTYQLAMMLAGTLRTTLDITGDLMIYGTGQADAVVSSSGANDLILETNSGTNSGTIRIYDGANGNIEFLNNGSGDVTIPTSGIVQGGTTATRCTFAVDGTTGIGFSITSATITSGDVLRVNHSSAATLNGGFLINGTVASSSVFSVAEDGAIAVAGTAAAAAFTATLGNLVLSQGTVAVTSTGTGDVVSVTANSVTANNLLVVNGSGTFTGTTTAAFVYINPSGLTTGTGLYLACGSATTTSYAADITTSTTTGSALRLTTSGVQTGVGSALEIIADSATTPGAVAGEGIVKVSADAITTGTLLDVTSTSIVLTTGRIADFSHISGNITGTLDKTVDFFNISSFRTVTTGTVSDDYNMLNLVRTSVINGGGTFAATGAVLYIENAITNTSGTVSDTVNGIELVMDSLGTGDGFLITDNRTTGSRVINMTAAVTTGTAMLMTLADLTTSGVGISITNSTSTGLTSGSLIRVTTATTGAVATNGVVSIRATGAYTSTSNVGLLDVLASGLTGAGTVVRIAASAAGQTASKLLHVEASGYTTGYTGDVMAVTGVSTTGASNLVLLTGANTTAGAMLRFTNNALTTGVGMIFAHTTSVIADTGSMLRLSSSSIDTGGATNGTILDIASTGATAGTAVLISDTASTTGRAFKVAATAAYTGTGCIDFATGATSGVGELHTHSSLTTGTGISVVCASANTGAWKGLSVSVTNTAATAAAPIRTSNVAVNNSKFTKILESTDGTKTLTIWMSQDATTPNGTLSGTAGDICLNGPSNRTFYCTGTTNWTASNA